MAKSTAKKAHGGRSSSNKKAPLASAASLKAASSELKSKHLHAKSTVENYEGHVKRGRKFILEQAELRCREIADGDQSVEGQAAEITATELLRVALDGRPNRLWLKLWRCISRRSATLKAARRRAQKAFKLPS
jgi:hypothetical protein